MSKISMQRDINGFNTFGLEFSDNNYNCVLAVGVAQSLTIPGDYAQYLAIFSIEPGANVWVSDNHVAVAPSASMAATYSCLNPVARVVKAADVLSLISENVDASVGISLYAIQ